MTPLKGNYFACSKWQVVPLRGTNPSLRHQH
jgi:hypothetical protein